MTIHAFPGMGADQRMYPAPWNQLPGFRAHNWVRHHGEESISEIASSMVAECKIVDGDIMLGSSLGGMVACEVTKLRRIPAIFLIGSALHPNEVSTLLSVLHPLASIAPFEWVKVSCGKIPADIPQMFSGTEASFVRSMCRAVFHWSGGVGPATKVYRIHGRRDLVIPLPTDVDHAIEGGHLISLTHPEECVNFIQKQLIVS